MLLFVTTSEGQIIIPLARVYNIVLSSCSVVINYDCGDIVWLDGDKYEKKIETVRSVYDSPDEANKVIRQFYKACNNNAGAFFFG